MENVTFDLASLHRHGSAFYDYLGLRKRFFVDELRWDIPHDDVVEMDQYDNPTARYSVVRRNGEIIGGARAQPTTAKWGEHTYMLRDALNGKLSDIPAWVMPSDVATAKVWECTRLVVSDTLRTHAERSACLALVVDGLVELAIEGGADQLICLSTLSLMRALRQLGYACEKLGGTYKGKQDGRTYAVLTMPAEKTLRPLPKRATHAVPQPMAVHAPAA
jgi:acyl homoserine lactone synthase